MNRSRESKTNPPKASKGALKRQELAAAKLQERVRVRKEQERKKEQSRRKKRTARHPSSMVHKRLAAEKRGE